MHLYVCVKCPLHKHTQSYICTDKKVYKNFQVQMVTSFFKTTKDIKNKTMPINIVLLGANESFNILFTADIKRGYYTGRDIFFSLNQPSFTECNIYHEHKTCSYICKGFVGSAVINKKESSFYQSSLISISLNLIMI